MCEFSSATPPRDSGGAVRCGHRSFRCVFGCVKPEYCGSRMGMLQTPEDSCFVSWLKGLGLMLDIPGSLFNEENSPALIAVGSPKSRTLI